MKLQQQPNNWSCFPTSFAMVAGLPVEDVFEILGTDGSEIVFPNLKEPFNRRSFGINELIRYMLIRKFLVIPLIHKYEQGPRHSEETYTYHVPMKFIEDVMTSFDGVISGFLPTGTGHAVAWCRRSRKAYDPAGKIVELSSLKLEIETFYLCTPLNKLLIFSRR